MIKYKDETVQFSVVIQMISQESGLISESYHAFDAHGVCDLEKGQVQILWPASDIGDERVFDSSITMIMKVVNLGQYALEPIVLFVGRLSCPDGTSYDAATGSCNTCLRSQYGTYVYII